MLSLLIKILQNETVINADFEFAKNEAIKEMQDLKLDIVRLSGTRSIIEVSDVLLSVIGMIQGQRLNAQSLSAILGYLKHDVSLLESLENPSQLKVETPLTIAPQQAQKVSEEMKKPGRKKLSK